MTASRLLAATAVLALGCTTASLAQAQANTRYQGDVRQYRNGNYAQEPDMQNRSDGYQPYANDRYGFGENGEGNGGYSNAEQNIIVTAPRWREEQSQSPVRPRWWPPAVVHLSETVNSRGLNLATADGAHAFRIRLRRAARDICDRLEQDYPYAVESSHRSCYARTIRQNMVHVDEAITNAEIRAGENPYRMEAIYRRRYGSW